MSGDWREWVFFSDKFQERYDGIELPEPRNAEEEYQRCIAQWIYQLQYFDYLSAKPTLAQFFAAHEHTGRICEETARSKWGRPPTPTLTPPEIEIYHQMFEKNREDLKRQGGGSQGGETNPLRFHVNGDELRNGARQMFSSVAGRVRNTLRDPFPVAAAVLGSVSQTMRNGVRAGASVPRPIKVP